MLRLALKLESGTRLRDQGIRELGWEGGDDRLRNGFVTIAIALSVVG